VEPVGGGRAPRPLGRRPAQSGLFSSPLNFGRRRVGRASKYLPSDSHRCVQFCLLASRHHGWTAAAVSPRPVQNTAVLFCWPCHLFGCPRPWGGDGTFICSVKRAKVSIDTS